MNNPKNIYIGIAIGLASIGSAFAQTPPDSTSLATEEVIIRKDFLPTISEANKINYEPQISEVKVPKINFDYDFLPKYYDTKFKADSIKAARIKGEPLDKLYRAFLKMGIGNYGTSYGTFHLNNLRSRNNLYGLKLYHHGSQGNVKDLPESGFNTNGALLHGKKFLKAHSIGLEAGYDRRKIHYYGIDNDLENIDIDGYEHPQVFQEITANASFASFYADSNKLNYSFTAGYTHLMDDADTKENHVIFNSKLEKYFGKELAQVFISADYNDNTFQNNNIIIGINPQITARGDKWNFSAGLKANIESDEDTKFRFYPKVLFNYNIFNDLVIPYVGVDGGLSRNNYNSLRKINPFVATPFEMINTNTRIHVFGGVRGTYSSTISFNLKASRKQVAHMPLYVNFTNLDLIELNLNTSVASSFNVIYDTVNITQLTAEIGYLKAKKLNVLGRIDYFSYDPDNEAKAWHLPDFKSTLTAQYDLRDKIVITASVFYLSKRYARTDNESDERLAAGVYGRELEGYVDANLGVEYRYNKKWSAFLNLNNIAAQTYETWNHYDSQRFNVLFGLSYGFWGK